MRNQDNLRSLFPLIKLNAQYGKLTFLQKAFFVYVPVATCSVLKAWSRWKNQFVLQFTHISTWLSTFNTKHTLPCSIHCVNVSSLNAWLVSSAQWRIFYARLCIYINIWIQIYYITWNCLNFRGKLICSWKNVIMICYNIIL